MNIQDVEIFNPGIDIEHPDGFSLQIKVGSFSCASDSSALPHLHSPPIVEI